VLALGEHRLVEDAPEVAGHRDRRHLVEAPGADRLGQGQRVAGALDVHRVVGRVVGRHVVDGREVEDVVDAPRVLGDPRGVDAQRGRRQVPGHRHDPAVVPLAQQGLEPGAGPLPDEHEDVALAVVEELLDEVAADEPGGTGHEVRHASGDYSESARPSAGRTAGPVGPFSRTCRRRT
jgi:hypothetical protein